MLGRISVENYALIERLDMELSPGLNIVTGETGAGKSILLGALGLVLGNRADTAALKDNSRNCVVEAAFGLAGYGLEKFFADNELEYEPETVIRRVITPAGKSRAYVNDLPVQLSTLKELSQRLIDIHSQHQSRMVADEGFRESIVDSVVAEPELPGLYRAAYARMRHAQAELAAAVWAVEEARRDQDYISHQHGLISELKLRDGEQEELEAEQKELANAEQILTALSQAEELLDRDETGILASLRSAQHALQHIAGVYPVGGELSVRMEEAYRELKDVASEISREGGRVEYNPARLAEADARLDAIYSLQQKFRLTSVGELLGFQAELAAKLAGITAGDENIARLQDAVSEYRREALGIGARLTEARTAAAVKLTAGVGELLSGLGMPAAVFACAVMPAEELTPSGADRIEFLFSANKGSMQPLERVASGGEVSRVMLALKSLAARGAKLPTIVFDEIDTGVSGRIADATGGIIAGLGESMQVLNITHLPQVASKGDTHFLVYKENTPEGAKTRIRRLTAAERVEEIAKMLSGSSVTEAALRQAETLLENGMQ